MQPINEAKQQPITLIRIKKNTRRFGRLIGFFHVATMLLPLESKYLQNSITKARLVLNDLKLVKKKMFSGKELKMQKK